MNIRKLAFSAATVVAAVVGSLGVTATPAAAMACDSGSAATIGAWVEYSRCQGETSHLSYTLYDSARDGRRAELWVRFPGTTSEGFLLDEVVTGAGTSSHGLFGPIDVPGIEFKVCSSNAGASRKCSFWN